MENDNYYGMLRIAKALESILIVAAVATGLYAATILAKVAVIVTMLVSG